MDIRKINIWIDHYDDLFSDFDPRPYSERSLSDDFIAEMKKVCREKDEAIANLTFEIPAPVRNSPEEEIIIKRLHAHFKKNYHNYKLQLEQLKRRAFLFLIIGFLLMISASFLSMIKHDLWITNILFVVIEPAGWFLVWVGFESLFYTSKRDKGELDFYQKLSKTQIAFASS